MKLHRVAHLARHLFEVTLVALGQDDGFDAGAVGGEHLFFDAADGQDAAAQRDLARHGNVGAHGRVQQERGDDSEERDAGRGPVFRDGALGDVQVQVDVLEPLGVEPQPVGARADEADGGLRRLLHHVLHVPGENDLAPAGHLGAFDEENVAAGGVPGEAGGDAGQGDALGHLGAVQVGAEHALEEGQVDRVAHVFALGDAHRGAAADGGDLPLEAAHAGLAGVVVDDVGDAGRAEAEALVGQAVLLELLGHQKVARDGDLLGASVAGDIDDLHPVVERRGDGGAVVGRGEKDDLRDVEGDVEVVVLKRDVLLGVEGLEQGGGRVAAHVDAELVDLVEHEHGVLAADALEGLNDAPGQRADVGAAVAAHLGLVAHAAEGDAAVAPAHRARDRAAERGLADAGRPEKEHDGPLLVGPQLPHRHVLENALLDLLEPEVVFVEAAAHLADVDAVGRRLGPGQVGEPLEVGARDVELGRLLLHEHQPAQLLLRHLLDVGRQLRLAQPLAQLFDLVVARLAQLGANRLHLLAQDVLALALAHLLLGHRRNFFLHLEHLELAADDAEHQPHPRLDVEGLQDLLLVADRGVLGRYVRRDEVGERAGLAHVVENARRLARQVGHQVEHLARLLAQRRRERVELDVARQRLGYARHVRLEVGLEPGGPVEPEAPEPVEHHAVVRGAKPNDFDHAGERADVVEVAERGLFDVGRALRQDADERALFAEQVFDEPHAALAAHVDGHDRHGKEHRVAQRQDGHVVDVRRGLGRRAGHGPER